MKEKELGLRGRSNKNKKWGVVCVFMECSETLQMLIERARFVSRKRTNGRRREQSRERERERV